MIKDLGIYLRGMLKCTHGNRGDDNGSDQKKRDKKRCKLKKMK